MAKNKIIEVRLFDEEVGRIGFDEHRLTTSFQFNPEFLASNQLINAFPKTGVLKRTPIAQIFNRFNGCLLYTSPSPRDKRQSRMPSSA